MGCHNKRLSYRREPVRRAKSVEILSATAQLYTKNRRVLDVYQALIPTLCPKKRPPQDSTHQNH